MRGSRVVSALLPVMLVAALCESATAGLVAQWSLDEGGGATTLESVSAASESINGATWITSDLPEVPTGTTAALQFDGTSSYVSSSFAGIGGAGDRSVAFWIKAPATDPALHGIVAWGDENADGEKWHIRLNQNINTGPIGAIRTEAQGGFIVGTTPLNDNQWHHVVSVFSGDSMLDVVHYIDGEVQGVGGMGADVAINTDILSVDAKPVSIGRRTEGVSQHYFDGAVDDVRIYDHALSLEEVQVLVTVPEPSSLVLAALGVVALLGFAARRFASRSVQVSSQD